MGARPCVLKKTAHFTLPGVVSSRPPLSPGLQPNGMSSKTLLASWIFSQGSITIWRTVRWGSTLNSGNRPSIQGLSKKMTRLFDGTCMSYHQDDDHNEPAVRSRTCRQMGVPGRAGWQHHASPGAEKSLLCKGQKQKFILENTTVSPILAPVFPTLIGLHGFIASQGLDLRARSRGTHRFCKFPRHLSQKSPPSFFYGARRACSTCLLTRAWKEISQLTSTHFRT